MMMIYYLKASLWLCVKEPETNPFVLELQKAETKKKKKTLLESSSSGAKPQRSHLGYYNELMKSPLEETLSLVMHVYRTFVYLCVRWYLVKHFIHCVLHLKH